MNLSDAISRYLADRSAKGMARKTVVNERTVLGQFLTCVGNIQVRSIAVRHIDAYWHMYSHWGANTCNRNKAILSSFFKWCRVRGHMSRDCDPLEDTRKRKTQPRDRVIIPVGMFEEVLNAAEKPRDRAAVAIGLYLFTRVSEIRNLRWQDIDFDQKVIRVHRDKTQTVDDLPMCAELERELRRWRLAYGESMGEVPRPAWYVIPRGSTPLYYTDTDGRLRQRESELLPTLPMNTVTSIVKAVLAKAGYDGAFEGGHTLRRSGATALYHELSERGHDRAIRMCQAMLGHASVQTTEIYLRLDLERKERNTLLGGKIMFSATGGKVISLGGAGGKEDGDAVHVR